MKIRILTIGSLIFQFHVALGQYKVDWGKYLNDSVPNAAFTKDEESEQLAVDIKNAAQNEEYVYVIGRSDARKDHETSCSENNQYYGAGDAFLAKYDRCGNLYWFKFLGSDKDGLPAGECGDFALCLALDHDSNGATFIYVAGYSYTNYNPSNCQTCSSCTSANSSKAFSCINDTCIFQKSKKSGTDCFIAKYDENGNLLKWTYFGGDGNTEFIFGIDILDHNVFVTGITNSNPDFIPLNTTFFDKTLASGGNYAGDAFVAEFDSLLCTLKFFSYFGGHGDDRGRGIKAYKRSNFAPPEFYLSGTTDAAMNEPAYHEINTYKGGEADGFISRWKFNVESGIFEPQWLEYVGGKKGDHLREIILSVDANEIILNGYTTSKDFITGTVWSYPDSNFYDKSFNNERDVFIAKFDTLGTPLWGTYFGGNKNDRVRGMVSYAISAEFSENYVVVVGGTQSTDLPIQPMHPPFQTSLNGGANAEHKDAFIAILTDPSSKIIKQQLEFSSYFGGTKSEWGEVLIHYGPCVALGGNNEIYLTFSTKSSNIENIITSPGYHYNKNLKGDNDGFLAKILNSDNPDQFDCSDFDWGFDIQRDTEMKMRNSLLNLYPNPATDKIIIDLEVNGNVNYEVLSMLGEEVIHGNWLADGSAKFIDISSFPAGFFILRCEINNQSLFQKFIITK